MLNPAVDPIPDVRVEREYLLPFISNCYRSATKKLIQSYQENRPAAILVSEGQFGPNYVIDKFLQSVDEDAVVVRTNGACDDPKALMQEVIRGVGFEPNNMTLDDLENVLELFLQYQRTHKHRTVIIIQDSEAHGWWVLDKIRRLVELEAQEKFGLMVVVSGRPGDISVLNEPILDVIISEAGERIILTPFTLAETRKYVRQRIEANTFENRDKEDVSEVFEFLAVTLMHDICAGVPDDVHQLCNECLEIFQSDGDELISIDTVKKAATMLGLTPPTASGDEDTVEWEMGNTVVPPGRLIIESDETKLKEAILDEHCFVIGRDALCNICIHGLRVSRFHAVVSLTPQGPQVADLGSTNGTTVNNEPATRHALQDGDVITIGKTRMVYLAGGEQLTAEPDIDATDSYEAVEPEQEPDPSITYIGKDYRLLPTS